MTAGEIIVLILSVATLGAVILLVLKMRSAPKADPNATLMLQQQLNDSVRLINEQMNQTNQALSATIQQLNAQVNQNLQQTNASLIQSLQQTNSSVNARLDQFGQTVVENLQQSTTAMNSRLDNAARVVSDLREKVGQIHEVGKAAAELVNILRAPKLRGGMGELFLGDLLSQILPPEHYRLQHRFKSGEAVDAVIQIGQNFVPVDAKFPYENFKRVVESATESERVAARKQFMRDVKKHVDAIATKYILPDEGTYDFALMYVPAENVYYETIIKDESADGERQLFSYALEKRVIPVSPNSFYAYLQTILLGLRGMKVEERAHEILNALARLRGDFAKVEESFRILGKHLTNASSSYAESEKALNRFEDKLALAEAPPKDSLKLPPPS